MTLGELAGDGGTNLLLIKIGHGVGAGVVVDGHLLLGDRFAAGEIGHVVDDRGTTLRVRTGCLETVVAAPLLRDRRDHLQHGLAVAGRRLGEALAPVVSTLNLHDVVLSGPLDVLDGTFRDAAVATIRNRTMPAVGDSVDLGLPRPGGRCPPRRRRARTRARHHLKPTGRTRR